MVSFKAWLSKGLAAAIVWPFAENPRAPGLIASSPESLKFFAHDRRARGFCSRHFSML
jgi:hypothetical protein